MGELTSLMMAQGVSATAQGVNAYSQTQAMRGAQQYNSSMTGLQSEWMDLQKADTLQRGDLSASRERLQSKQIEAAMKVKAVGQGVDVNSGSAAAVRSDQRLFSELAQLDAKNSAFRQALGLRAEQSAMMGRDKMNRLATKNQIRNTLLQTGANVTGDAFKSYAMYERYKGLGGGDKSSFDYSEQNDLKKVKDDWKDLD